MSIIDACAPTATPSEHLTTPPRPFPADPEALQTHWYAACAGGPVVHQYGPESVAELSEPEKRLVLACKGVDRGDFAGLLAAVTSCFPMPTTVAEAWQEFDWLNRRDEILSHYGLGLPMEMDLRRYAVEPLLTELDARTAQDHLARLAYLRFLADLGNVEKGIAAPLCEAIIKDTYRLILAAGQSEGADSVT